MMRPGLFAIGLVMLAFVVAACGDDDGGSRNPAEDALEVGDCLLYAGVGDVRPVYCFEEHHAEVIDVLTMPDGVYPGDEGINRFSLENCPEATNTFVYPTLDSWALGDRAIACLEEDLEALEEGAP